MVQKGMRGVAIAFVVAVIGIAILTWPICEPLDEEVVRTMNPPIYRRTERRLWFKIYRIKNDQWCECKPWIERKLFF
jgi:hypothetical protein